LPYALGHREKEGLVQVLATERKKKRKKEKEKGSSPPLIVGVLGKQLSKI